MRRTCIKVTVGITQILNTHPFDDNLATVSHGDAFFSLTPSNIDHALRAVGSSHLTTGYKNEPYQRRATGNKLLEA